MNKPQVYFLSDDVFYVTIGKHQSRSCRVYDANNLSIAIKAVTTQLLFDIAHPNHD